MTLQYTHTRLLVDDYAACVKFYRDKLGLKVRYGDEKSGYVEFDMDNITLALFKRELMGSALGARKVPARKKGVDQVVMCLRVDDVDAACKELRRKRVALVAQPTDRPDWRIRTAHLRDPDGNLIEINAPKK